MFLFLSMNTFKQLMNPQEFIINLKKKSTREDSFVGNVVLNIVKVNDDRTKQITFRYLKGRNKVRFPPQIGAKGNPVFMLFLKEMLEICKDLRGGMHCFLE